MVELFDGPAKGAKLNLRRIPVFLRVVISQSGVVDALDMPEDTPNHFEDIYAYRVVNGTQISTFMCGSTVSRGCAQFNSALYKLCPEQPEESILQDRKKWEVWVEETAEKEKV